MSSGQIKEDLDNVSSCSSLSSDTTPQIRTDHRLPPILEGRSGLSDWCAPHFECPFCPSAEVKRKKMTLASLVEHSKWHARVNLLTHLRTIMKEVETSPFGPLSLPGILLTLSYENDDRVLKAEVSEYEARIFLRRLCKDPQVSLSYGEGRKYTFGTKFLSRESQGDFLYFQVPLGEDEDDDDDDEDDMNSKKENYFQLECRDEGLWISNAHVEGCEPSTVVSVNGLPLGNLGGKDGASPSGGVEESRKLEFGDVVTISTGDDEESVDILFKASVPKQAFKSLGGDQEKIFVGGSKSALDNPLILENILHFLPTKTLQDLRPLSQLWNEESRKVLRNRVFVSICALGWRNSDQALLRISDYGHSQLHQLNFPHWKMALPIGLSEKETKMRWMEDEKVLSDLTWLLGLKPQTFVKSLQLSGRLETSIRFRMFDTVIRSLASSLSSLALKFNCIQTLHSVRLEEMRALKTLSLSVGRRKDDTTKIFRRFLRLFLPAVTSIQSLHLVDSSILGDTPRFATLVVQEVAAMQGEKPEAFAALTEVAVVRPSRQLGLGSLRPGSLRKVGLGDLITGQTFIGTLLGHHVHTVTDLTIHYKFQSQQTSGLKIRFPEKMPNLNSLSVFFGSNLHFGIGIWNFAVGVILREEPLQFRFGGSQYVERIDYSTHFPTLSNLTVWPVGTNQGFGQDGVYKTVEGATWEKFLPALVPFIQIPVNAERAGMIKALDIPFTLEGKYHEELNILASNFPNFPLPPELLKARDGPLYEPVVVERSFSESDIDEDEGSP